MSNSYSDTFAPRNVFVGISGIIGVGKSTLTEQLGTALGWNTAQEPVDSNPYLNKFYEDIPRYSFQMQVFLLNHRFKQHQQMVWSNHSLVQDRTIYEDVIFAKMLQEDGLMDELDFQTYVDLFRNMTNFLHRPDVIIYLDVEPAVALQRVRERSRGCESSITIEYLTKLRAGYEEWLDDVGGRIPVLRIDWNQYQSVESVIGKLKTLISSRRGLVF